jgi:TRAP-type C4-dicarboxylate transport system substrate-binding protein
MKVSNARLTSGALLFGLIAIFVFSLGVTPTHAEKINLRVASYVPPVVHLAKALDWWAAEVKKQTNGRVEPTVFHGQALGKVPDSLDMLDSGTADVAILPAPAFPGRFPVTELISDTPLLKGNIRITNEVMNQLLMKGLLKEYDKYMVVGWFTVDPMLLFVNKKINSLEQLKGMKIRARGRASTEIVERLGASPVAIGFGELYTSLERGIIDGATLPMTAFAAIKLYEVCKYVIDVPLYGGVVPILMSKRSWDKIPAEDKPIVERINQNLSYAYFNMAGDELIKGYQAVTSDGRQKIMLDPQEKKRWEETISPVIQEALDRVNKKGLPGEEIMAVSQSVLKFWEMSGLQ